MCKGCGSRPANAMFIPCEHTVVCTGCADVTIPVLCAVCVERLDGFKPTFVVNVVPEDQDVP